jgi:hypothetical protein
MTRIGYTLALLAASVLAPACTDTMTPKNEPPPGSTTSGDSTQTFDHDNTGISPWDLLDRIETEGPPRYTSHVHSCPKVRYKTLGTVLSEIGVNMGATGAVSAAQLYATGDNALGAANYANRIRENIGITTSGASREYDIFAAAAPEVLAAFTAGSLTRCPGALLFDSGTSTTCRPDGIQCLIGTVPTTDHVDYCNLTVQRASTVTVGQQLAVAAMLAAAYTCE